MPASLICSMSINVHIMILGMSDTTTSSSGFPSALGNTNNTNVMNYVLVTLTIEAPAFSLWSIFYLGIALAFQHPYSSTSLWSCPIGSINLVPHYQQPGLKSHRASSTLRLY